jgi:heterodisulfide reductase subunit C
MSKSKRKPTRKTKAGKEPRKPAEKIVATAQQSLPSSAIQAPSPAPPKVEKSPETKPLETTPVKAHEFDPHFKYELSKMHGGEKLKQCFQCGTCTSDCPIARFSDSYRPRTIIRMAQLGLKDRVLSSETLWLCASCFTCNDRCPQDVEVAGVIRILRNAAAQRGTVPQVFKELGSSILESGVAYRIPELRLRKRGEIGLPPLPKGNPDAMVKLAEATGFSKMLKKKGE